HDHRATRGPGLVRVRRADPEPARGKHTGSGRRLSRPARLYGGRRGEGGSGAVPDGQETVSGAARPGQGGVATAAGCHGERESQSDPYQTPGGAGRTVTETLG